jgi:hypothetical protein
MKKFTKPSSLAFIFLMPVVFFVIGIYFAGLIGAGQNQGLAAGAIVVGWGFLFGFVAFILSFIIVKKGKVRQTVRLNFILLLLAIILYGFAFLRFQQKQKENSNEKFELQPEKPTNPGLEASFVTMEFQPAFSDLNVHFHRIGLNNSVTHQNEIGIGFFSPSITENGSLYFYGAINFDKTVQEHTPHDSISFGITPYGHFEILYAPPWFYPEHLKLDYDMLYLKVLTAGREFLEVEVNRETGQTAWVDRFKGNLVYWPDFLLNVHSVEFIDPANQKVMIKPLTHASEVLSDYTDMHPKLIKDEWLKVDLSDENLNKLSEGWIKWKENNRLLIIYSLLS